MCAVSLHIVNIRMSNKNEERFQQRGGVFLQKDLVR